MAVRSFGLQNTGSICYFNSLIQGLISCPIFISAIKRHVTSNNEVAVAFAAFLDHIMSTDTPVITANPILQQIVNTHVFFGRQQEDASEGFDLLLEKLGDNISKVFESKWRVDVYCDTCNAFVSNATDTMNRLIMEQKYIALSDDGFEGYASAHMSQFDDYTCNTCKKKNVKGMKVSRLIAPPDIYVISFNKFLSKWKDEDYPYEMDVIYDRTKKKTYRLAAIIKHYGGRDGGHYTAIGIRGPKAYAFNDAQCTETKFTQSENDYMLFYIS